MENFRLTASMMCANFSNLEKEVRELEEGGIDAFHIDIMDGRFVPNFGMGLQDLKYIRSATKKEIDVHLMIERPLTYLKIFTDLKVDVIYFHPEADYHPSTTIQAIIEEGIVPGIAINPGTSVETVYELLGIVDRVLVMSVNPGNAGQVYLPYVGKKIKKLASLKDELDFKIFWDGACTANRILEFQPNGVDGFVLGSSLLFGKKRSYKDIITDIRNLKFEV